MKRCNKNIIICLSLLFSFSSMLFGMRKQVIGLGESELDKTPLKIFQVSPDGKYLAVVYFNKAIPNNSLFGRVSSYISRIQVYNNKDLSDYNDEYGAFIDFWRRAKKEGISLSSFSCIKVFNIKTGDQVLKIDGGFLTRFSPNGKYLAANIIGYPFHQSREHRGSLTLFNIETGKVVKTINAFYSLSCEFSPDSRYLCLLGKDDYSLNVTYLKLLNAETGDVKPLGDGLNFGFSPDGEFVVLHRLGFFDIVNDKELVVKECASFLKTKCFGFSPDGNYFFYISYSETLNLLSVNDIKAGNLKPLLEIPNISHCKLGTGEHGQHCLL